MVTNASNFNKEQSYKMLEYLDEIVFSIDFIDDVLNEKYGRGKNHFNHISEVIKNIKCYYPKCFIGINTVVMRPNLTHIEEIYNHINSLEINEWKLIQFCSFRGMARENSDSFFITEREFNDVQEKYKSLSNFLQIESHTAKEMQLNHIVITPSGKFTK